MSNTESNGEPVVEPVRSVRRWLVAGLALFVLIALSYAGMFLIAAFFDEPVVKSIDEIDAAKVSRLGVLAINRPDGGPDITSGGKDPFPIPTGDIAAVLQPLRGGQPLATDRGIYLGVIQIAFHDGRKVKVMLHRAGDTGLRVSIGKYQYDAGSLKPFFKVLDEVESRMRQSR